MPKHFFEERSDQSEIKARIVQRYFDAWARVIMPWAEKSQKKISYVDLYAGPGRYRDGAASTPLLVLERAIRDPRMAKMLVAMFNDMDTNNSTTLQHEIDSLPGISSLTYPPRVLNNEVDQDAEAFFASTRLVPTFSFIDPFGYKGLSLKIIHGVIKDWGCDCVFFFNYNRINAGLSNPAVDEHLNGLFGEHRAQSLRSNLAGKAPHQREAYILEELAQALREKGGTYVLPFRFKNAAGSRTSHCLVFVSKSVLGYKIMKEIMASESSVTDQGVPSFTYSPADEATPLLFSLAGPLEALENLLLERFKGQRLTMQSVFEEHNIDTPYISKNYKDALRTLEARGLISCEPPAVRRRKLKGQPTFAEGVVVSFPMRKANG